jgi:hypothetical protein
MAIVYQHKRIDTGEVFYVGIGKNENRAYSKHSRGKFWKDYTLKYEYEVEITHKDIIWEEACSIEKYLISFYGRRDLGLGSLVNQTDGGEGNNGIIQSDEANKKRSTALKGKKKPKGFNIGRVHSEKTKNKISTAHKKMKKPWAGKNTDRETIVKRAMKRRVLSYDEYIMINTLKKEKMTLKDISNKTGINYGIIKKWHNRDWNI